MSAPRHRTVESLDLSLHCLEWGEPGGSPIVLVHGFLDMAYSWQSFVESLEAQAGRNLWIVAPDCRGHGDSEWVGKGGYYHFPDYVLDLDHVVRALGDSPAQLVGHSMGGTISMLYAGAFPERLSSLVLVEGIGPLGMQFSDAPKRMATWISEVHERERRHFRQYTSVEAGARQLQQTNPRLSDSAAVILAGHGMRQNAAGKWVWKFDPLHRTAAPQPFYTAQALEFLRRITCPILTIEGGLSRQSRRTDKDERFGAMANRRHDVIDDAGHMVHHDAPQKLADVIFEFLQRSKLDWTAPSKQ